MDSNMITYVVEGSDDGLLLGTTSKKAAIKRACDYTGDYDYIQGKRLSDEITNKLKEYNKFTVDVVSITTATITVFDSKF